MRAWGCCSLSALVSSNLCRCCKRHCHCDLATTCLAYVDTPLTARMHVRLSADRPVVILRVCLGFEGVLWTCGSPNYKLVCKAVSNSIAGVELQSALYSRAGLQPCKAIADMLYCCVQCDARYIVEYRQHAWCTVHGIFVWHYPCQR